MARQSAPYIASAIVDLLLVVVAVAVAVVVVVIVARERLQHWPVSRLRVHTQATDRWMAGWGQFRRKVLKSIR